MNNLISIIIVTYNNEDTIVELLKSIETKIKYPHEVIVVDNNSKDLTIRKIKESKTKIHLLIQILIQKENLGFSKANNLGARASKGEFLFFLNPDCVIIDDSFGEFANYLKDNQQIGILGPKLVKPDGQTQSSVTNLPTIFNAIQEFYFGQKYKYREYAPNATTPIEVEAVYGAAILMKKATLVKVGYWDERYFLYFEDLDLCRKIRGLGLKVIYYPRFKIQHKVGSSTGKSLTTLSLHRQASKVYHGRLNSFLLNIIFKLRRFWLIRSD